MAFKEVGGSRHYFKYNECAQGQVLVESGVYVGEEDGTYGIQHVFDVDGGSQIVLNSSGQLNYQLQKSKAIGKTCRVVYEGKKLLDKGKGAGKEAHQFKLLIDNDVPADAGIASMAVGAPPPF